MRGRPRRGKASSSPLRVTKVDQTPCQRPSLPFAFFLILGVFFFLFPFSIIPFALTSFSVIVNLKIFLASFPSPQIRLDLVHHIHVSLTSETCHEPEIRGIWVPRPNASTSWGKRGCGWEAFPGLLPPLSYCFIFHLFNTFARLYVHF
ncbi:hypothetical protein IE53DRAFT_227967 [Violaceomyces palustris]|uniref:Uncharacterized protein n=1 Tax=Violaceomyces palustris TaxID=1673888 RepID=A0ACD0NPV3_9BASI|nr:hypothetical protein IE53DRAFT_227967 [Violaceomyces palustris]